MWSHLPLSLLRTLIGLEPIYCIINQIRIDFAWGSTLDLWDPSLFVFQLYSIYYWQETRFPPNSTELSLTSFIPSDFSLSLPRKDGLYFNKIFLLFFFFLVSIFILYFIKLWNVISQQPKLGEVLYILQGYWNLIGTWFHMRNMNWFHKVYDLA